MYVSSWDRLLPTACTHVLPWESVTDETCVELQENIATMASLAATACVTGITSVRVPGAVIAAEQTVYGVPSPDPPAPVAPAELAPPGWCVVLTEPAAPARLMLDVAD